MTDVHSEVFEGTVSSKHQVTIPAPIWEALGLRPGNKIEFQLEMNNELKVRVKRPMPSEIIAALLEQYDVRELQEYTKNDAVKSVREDRWGDDL